MKIAFYKAKQGDWTDKLIAWWTRPSFFKFWESGLYSHVEYVFEFNSCFSASPREGKTRWKGIENIETSNNWEIINYDLVDDYDLVVNFNSINNLPYDWKCIFFSQVLPLDVESPKKWICSEIGAKYIFNLKYAHKYSPNKLYKYIKEKNGVF